MTTKRKAVIAYIEHAQYAALKKLSAKTGAPMQHYIRGGIDLILAKHKRRARK